MKYLTLTEEQQASVVTSQRASLEREHYATTVALKIAEGLLREGIPGSDSDVVALNEKLHRLELSILSLE